MEQEQKIDVVVRLVARFDNKPFKVHYKNHTLRWRHPTTNEGLPDPDYLVFSMDNINCPPIWSFRGNIDIESTVQDFVNAKVQEDDLTLLEQACRHVAHKMRTRNHWISKWIKFDY